MHCSCGNEFTTRSTVPSLRVELCSECHPFYTGKQKLVDTGGRVERFQRRLEKTKAKQGTKAKGLRGAAMSRTAHQGGHRATWAARRSSKAS